MWHRKQWPLRWGKRWRTSPLLFPSFFGFGNWSHTFRIDCSILEQIVGCQTVPCTGRFQFISSIWLYSDRRCRGRMFMNLVENVDTTPAQHHPWGPNWFTTVNGLNPINLSKLMKSIWPYYNIKIISEGADLRTYWTCQTKKKRIQHSDLVSIKKRTSNMVMVTTRPACVKVSTYRERPLSQKLQLSSALTANMTYLLE